MLTLQSKIRVGGRALCGLCFLLFACGMSPAQTFESTESRFLGGLRERRLFELAESFCRAELAETYTARRRRVELTTELARTVLESALYAKPPLRDERFAAAGAVLDEFRFEGADDPWRVPIAAQRGITDLVWGELLREEAQSLSTAATALDPARARLQLAVTLLRKTRGEIERHLQLASRPGAPTQKPDEPTPVEWQALKRNVDYQLARAYRNQAESYPPRSADRTAALDQALETLALLSRSETADGLAWQARLDEVVCRRLLGDLDGAERMLALIDEQQPPAATADRARAQRIRIRLDAGLPDEAQKFVRETDADPTAAVEPDARLAVLEWMLAAARTAAKAGRRDDVQRYRELAGGMTRLLVERHSAYWGRRGEALLAAAVAETPGGGDAALLVRAAESMYQQGNIDRALELYDQAATKAREAKQREAAFSAAFTAAAIEQERRRPAAAADRFLQLVAAGDDHPRAAEAHLAGIFNTAQMTATAQDPTERQAGLARYAKLLDEHLARWPQGSTTSQAAVWLGRLRKLQHDLSGAVAAYGRVAPDGLHAAEAIPALRECYELMLSKLPASERAAGLREAEAALFRFVPQKEGILGAASPTARAALLARARLALQFGRDGFETIAATLVAAAAAPEIPEQEVNAMETLLVLTDVLTGKTNDAALRIGRLTTVAPGEATIVAERLQDWLPQQPADVRVRVAPIALRLLELRRSQDPKFPPTATEAELLAAAGRTAEARRVWDALVRQFPREEALHESFAEFLSAQPDAVSQTAAVAQWRTLERLAAESSPRWYRARLGLARAYVRTGDRSRAAQLLELTAALHPDLGGDALRAEFEKLSAQLRSR